MRCFVIVLVLLSVAPGGVARAACAKPDVPACAIQTVPFPLDKDADDCRKDMVRYRDATDIYASCLGQASADEEKKAREDYETIRVKFNQRARGEFPK